MKSRLDRQQGIYKLQVYLFSAFLTAKLYFTNIPWPPKIASQRVKMQSPVGDILQSSHHNRWWFEAFKKIAESQAAVAFAFVYRIPS